jgi:hypothetical protein
MCPIGRSNVLIRRTRCGGVMRRVFSARRWRESVALLILGYDNDVSCRPIGKIHCRRLTARRRAEAESQPEVRYLR